MELSAAGHRILAAMLEARTGQQLVAGRQSWVESALKPVLRDRGFETFDALLGALLGRTDAGLAKCVTEALLNNETFFFRDPAAFALLIDQGLPRLADARPRGHVLRIWCAGCSTGQEVWSLAMMFAERPERWRGCIEIVGTDISGQAIDQAQRGVYSQREVQRGLPIGQLMRWFQQDRDGWGVTARLRAGVRFQRQGLGEPAPAPGRFDLILCRNVMLYFASPMRARVFATLASAIAPDGMLMLGAGETVLGQTARFASDPDARGLYRPVTETAAARRSGW